MVSASHGLSIHAYVLMTNHVHLLATGATSDSLPTAMQAWGRRYVSYFNKRHDRSGTLWEGRYKAPLVASARYLMHTHRYIELNPVRAGMAPNPEAYPWSSNRFYLLGRPDDLVTPHELWFGLGGADEERRAFYGDLLRRPLDDAVIESIRKGTRTGMAIGDPDDCKALEVRSGRRVTAARRGWIKGRARGR